MKKLRVLGVDPGVSKVGWAIIEEGSVIDFGVESFKSEAKAFNDKINEEVRDALRFFDEKLKGVDAVGWEIVPSFGQMSQRDRIVGIATAVKVLAWQKKLLWKGISPIRMKTLATKKRSASKQEIKEACYTRYPDLPIRKKLSVDAFDAIMIATVLNDEGEWHE